MDNPALASSKNGFIYLLSNQYIPNIFKIGYTTRNSQQRAKEISKATGIPGEWVVYKDWFVENAYSVEQKIFHEFKSNRIDNSELFDFGGENITEVSILIQNFITQLKVEQKELIAKTEATRLANIQKKQIALAYKKQVHSFEEELTAKINLYLQQRECDIDYIKYLSEQINVAVNKRIDSLTTSFKENTDTITISMLFFTIMSIFFLYQFNTNLVHLIMVAVIIGVGHYIYFDTTKDKYKEDLKILRKDLVHTIPSQTSILEDRVLKYWIEKKAIIAEIELSYTKLTDLGGGSSKCICKYKGKRYIYLPHTLDEVKILFICISNIIKPLDSK